MTKIAVISEDEFQALREEVITLREQLSAQTAMLEEMLLIAKKKNPMQEWVICAEASRVLNLNPKTVRSRARKGLIERKQIAGEWRYKIS